MNVLVTLNSGLGAQLGPNFNLTVDVGIVYPSTATLAELLAGIYVTVLDSAQIITVTSTGECTNSIELVIAECTTTTTSTTSTTSTTTTTTTVECTQFVLLGLNGGGTWEAITCTGDTIEGNIPAGDFIFTGCIITSSLVIFNGTIDSETPCGTTTTTSTTAAPLYTYCAGYSLDDPYAACEDYANCLLTTTTLAPHDMITGSFTITNRVESVSIVNVNLGGYGTNDYVFVNETKSFSVSGNVYSPNSAIFTISTPGGTDPINVTADTLIATGVLDVLVVGGGTATVTIVLTPTNYNSSYDVISGNLTIIVG
jgi:hypothetical protein